MVRSKAEYRRTAAIHRPIGTQGGGTQYGTHGKRRYLDPTLTELGLMATLTNEVKLFIVQALACFDTPSQVVIDVKEKFGVTVSRQQCEAYNPTKMAGSALGTKWATVFEDTRKRFREEVADIPIASRAFRLRALGRMAQQAEGMRNIALAASVIERAAKEVGDIYVNKGRSQPADATAPTSVAATFGMLGAPDYSLSAESSLATAI
ncbi:MAG: hypothetical protein JWL97_4326 [Gemmatimonadales bacterium]|nr:hypothetical protein [Gemmatimonadales bacterium]